jgi:hypothetical protein
LGVRVRETKSLLELVEENSARVSFRRVEVRRVLRNLDASHATFDETFFFPTGSGWRQRLYSRLVIMRLARGDCSLDGLDGLILTSRSACYSVVPE